MNSLDPALHSKLPTKSEYLLEINNMIARGVPCYDHVDSESSYSEVRYVHMLMKRSEKEQEARHTARELTHVIYHLNRTIREILLNEDT